MAQENEVVPFNGIVTDLTGTPLRGVKIYVTDANYAAKSDRKGRFGLSNVKGTDTLHVVFRKLHYDIPVAGRKAIPQMLWRPIRWRLSGRTGLCRLCHRCPLLG